MRFCTSERCIASPAPNRNRASSNETNSARSVSGPGTERARTLHAGLPAILTASFFLYASERTRGASFGVPSFTGVGGSRRDEVEVEAARTVEASNEVVCGPAARGRMEESRRAPDGRERRWFTVSAAPGRCVLTLEWWQDQRRVGLLVSTSATCWWQVTLPTFELEQKYDVT